jgi:ABC-type uncharacterized transport system substrate-binding protein
VSVIAATGGIPSARSAKEATASIPIVFITGNDPVNAGLVPNFNQPGGNITGVAFLINTLGAKRLELLREVIPGATTIGMLVNPTNPDVVPETKDMRAAADAIGRRLAGGLMSYGTSIIDAYRQAGTYVALILRGKKPADLPVVQPTKFELVINLYMETVME